MRISSDILKKSNIVVVFFTVIISLYIYLDQINIFDDRQIYPNTSLASYIKNDKVAIKAETLYKLNTEKQRIIRELELLKNGKI